MCVFRFDLLRTTRRGRPAVLRVVYALVLLLALAALYARWFPGGLYPYRWFDNPAKATHASARFANDYVTTCLVVQFVAAVVLTPAYAAASLAEERQRGTLDLMLATDLSPAAIVLGKFAARWLAVVGLMLTPAPILALAQLWGGTPWQLLAFGAGLTLLTTLSLAALGVLCSVRAESVRGAVAGTYAAAAALGGLAAAIPFLRFGDPWSLAKRFVVTDMFGQTRAPWLLLLLGYAIWHGAVCLLALTWAVWLLRPQPLSKIERDLLRRAYERLPAGSRIRVFLAPHLLVGAPAPWAPGTRRIVRRRVLVRIRRVHGNPFLWKEWYFGGPAIAGELTQVIVFGLIVGGLAVGAAFVLFALFGAFPLEREEAIRTYRPLAGDVAAALLPVVMIAAAVRTAGSIGRERDRKTLDTLLVLPVRVEDILWPKWLGGLYQTRWLMVAFAALLVVSALAGAVSLPAVFWVTFAGAIHVLFAASLGLFVSVVTRGTGRAIVLTVLGLVAAWLLPQAVAGRWLGSSIEPTWLTGLFHYGLSPPATWRYLGFASESRHYSRGDEVLLGVLAGLAMYAAAAWFLWRAAVAELHLRRG
jgi:ABC-type transport system involved in multi-copper enzyme maturation permease subunit